MQRGRIPLGRVYGPTIVDGEFVLLPDVGNKIIVVPKLLETTIIIPLAEELASSNNYNYDHRSMITDTSRFGRDELRHEVVPLRNVVVPKRPTAALSRPAVISKKPAHVISVASTQRPPLAAVPPRSNPRKSSGTPRTDPRASKSKGATTRIDVPVVNRETKTSPARNLNNLFEDEDQKKKKNDADQIANDLKLARKLRAEEMNRINSVKNQYNTTAQQKVELEELNEAVNDGFKNAIDIYYNAHNLCWLNSMTQVVAACIDNEFGRSFRQALLNTVRRYPNGQAQQWDPTQWLEAMIKNGADHNTFVVKRFVHDFGSTLYSTPRADPTVEIISDKRFSSVQLVPEEDILDKLKLNKSENQEFLERTIYGRGLIIGNPYAMMVNESLNSTLNINHQDGHRPRVYLLVGILRHTNPHAMVKLQEAYTYINSKEGKKLSEAEKAAILNAESRGHYYADVVLPASGDVVRVDDVGGHAPYSAGNLKSSRDDGVLYFYRAL